MSILLTAVYLSGCSNPFSKVHLTKDRESVRAETLAFVPIGTSIADTEKLMVSDEFSCGYKENSGFIEAAEGERFAEHKAIDYLYCMKTKNWMIVCAVQWDLALRDQNGKLSDVYVGYHSFCL